MPVILFIDLKTVDKKTVNPFEKKDFDCLIGLEKLVSLSEFITEVNSKFPLAMTADRMAEVVFDKYRKICQYNEFLQKRLTIEMFEGEFKLFEGGQYVDLQPSVSWNCYMLRTAVFQKKIFQDTKTCQSASLGYIIADISGMGVKLIKP